MSIRFLWCLCCPRPLAEQEVLTQGLPGHTTVRRLEVAARSLEEEYDKTGEGCYVYSTYSVVQDIIRGARATSPSPSPVEDEVAPPLEEKDDEDPVPRKGKGR